MERDAFPVPYLLDKIHEDAFHGQAVKTVAYLRVSAAHPQESVHTHGQSSLEDRQGGSFLGSQKKIASRIVQRIYPRRASPTAALMF